jgi:hypothetical protein
MIIQRFLKLNFKNCKNYYIFKAKGYYNRSESSPARGRHLGLSPRSPCSNRKQVLDPDDD